MLLPAFEGLEDLVLPSSSILGSAWVDRNGDGIRGPGDDGLAGQAVYLDLNRDGVLDTTDTTVAAQSTAIAVAPGPLGEFGFFASLLQVPDSLTTIQTLKVSIDLANAGTSAVTVAVASPVGLIVPNLPTLFEIEPGEHFIGTFDLDAARPITLAMPAADGTLTGAFRPEQSFNDPPAHIFDGSASGTWALAFLGDTSGLILKSWSLTFGTLEPNTKTNSLGNYTFERLEPGSYRVGTVRSRDEVLTRSPLPDTSQIATLAQGQTVSGVDFGIELRPDVVASSTSLIAPATAWGQDVTLVYALANQGRKDAPPFTAEIHLSDAGGGTAPGPLLGTVHLDGLGSGSSQGGSLTLHLPDAPPPGFALIEDAYLSFNVDPAVTIPAEDSSDAGSVIPLGTPPNAPIVSSPSVEQQPSIAVDPNDPKHLVVASMDYSLVQSGYAGIGVSVSFDGGRSWQRSAVPFPAGFEQGAAVPIARFDGRGHVFVSFMAATFLGPDRPGLTVPASAQRKLGFLSNNGIFVARSDDGGLSWGQPVSVTSRLFTGTEVLFDVMPDLAVDNFPTLLDGRPNPNYGTLYSTWVRLYPSGQFPGQPDSTGGSDVMFAVSRDGGITWTTRMQTDPVQGIEVSVIKDPDFGTNATSAPGRGFSFFPHITVGPEGDLYVSMFGAGDFTVFHSTDAGASFRPPDRARQLGVPFIATLPTPTLFGDNFRTISARAIVADPVHPGRVYVTESNNLFSFLLGGVIDAGQIIFARSDDYGQTWTSTFQVRGQEPNLNELPPGENDAFQSVLNDDDRGRFLSFADISQLNGEVISGQALPSLAIDAQGNLTEIWYDTRRDPTGVRLDVFGTISTDGGKTFTPNFRITDTTFDPNEGTFIDAAGAENFFLGDQISVAVANGVAYTVWTDTRSRNQDVYFQKISILHPPSPDPNRFFPNSTPETATKLGTLATELLIPRLTVSPGNDNWFELQAGGTGELLISARADGAGDSPRVELVDASGNVLPATVTNIVDAAGLVVGQQLVHASTAGESFLVHVRGSGTAGLDYSLVVAALTGNFGATVQGATTGVLLGADEAIYRVKTGVSGSLQVTLRPGQDMEGTPTIMILGPDGRRVLATGAPSGEDASAEQRVTIPVTRGQDVLLKVTTFGDPSIFGSFELRYTNQDQYEAPGGNTRFFPTGGQTSVLAVAKVPGATQTAIVTTDMNSDSIRVMTSAPGGALRGLRAFGVGPGETDATSDQGREPALVDLTGDGILDAVAPNPGSSNVSVLVGDGHGSFLPERRFDALPHAGSLAAADLRGVGVQDLVVLQTVPEITDLIQFAVLLGRGDGTFLPPAIYTTQLLFSASSVRVADINHDGRSDVVVLGRARPVVQIFLANSDGTLRDAGLTSVGENLSDLQLADLDGDGNVDLVGAALQSGNVLVLLGNGDGSFRQPQVFPVKPPDPHSVTNMFGLAVADLGSTTDSGGLGPPDGHPDLLILAQSSTASAPAELFLVIGRVDSMSQDFGLDPPVVVSSLESGGRIATGDFTGDGLPDVAIATTGGVTVVYGSPPAIPPNTSPLSAQDLGSVTHMVVPARAILADHEDAYFTFTVPAEPVASGDQVVEVSALLDAPGGAGLGLEVIRSDGVVVGSGGRSRFVAAQGETFLIHVFGQFAPDGTRGVGAYTLDIDVLPQVVSVQAQSILPGGPAASLVITSQGDRLDPASAQDPANYAVTWLGPDGREGTADDQNIPIASISGGQAIVYNPSTSVETASGLSYQTAARQTLTLLFASPLPPGSYRIVLSPEIRAAAAAAGEPLAGDPSFRGHPLVSIVGGIVVDGSRVLAQELVSQSGTPGDPTLIAQGTPFLTQLHDDLAALLDQLISRAGDDFTIGPALNDQIQSRFAPTVSPLNGLPFPSNGSYIILWLDPVSIDLQAPTGSKVTYNLATNAVSNEIRQTFVQVGGSVELIVLANPSGTYRLNVADVPQFARGGAVLLSPESSELLSFTYALRNQTTSFVLNADAIPTVPGPPGRTEKVVATPPAVPSSTPPVPAPGNAPGDPAFRSIQGDVSPVQVGVSLLSSFLVPGLGAIPGTSSATAPIQTGGAAGITSTGRTTTTAAVRMPVNQSSTARVIGATDGVGLTGLDAPNDGPQDEDVSNQPGGTLAGLIARGVLRVGSLLRTMTRGRSIPASGLLRSLFGILGRLGVALEVEPGDRAARKPQGGHASPAPRIPAGLKGDFDPGSLVPGDGAIRDRAIREPRPAASASQHVGASLLVLALGNQRSVARRSRRAPRSTPSSETPIGIRTSRAEDS